MSRFHKPLKRSQIQKTRRGPILGPLCLWDLRKLENHRHSSKTLCNKLDVMYQIYSYILLWVDFINLSRDRKSNKLGEGPFLDPSVSGTSENSKTTDIQVRLFVTNFVFIFKFIYVLCYNRLHKTSKGLCKAQTPQGLHFWTLVSDLRKLEKHRPSSKTLCNKLYFYIQIYLCTLL